MSLNRINFCSFFSRINISNHKKMQDTKSDEDSVITYGKPLNFTPNPYGLGHEIYKKMVHFSNAVAQIDALTGVKDTYGHLLERCICTAIEMRKRGVTSEDIITICSTNHLNSCVPYIASMFLGAKPACLDPSLSVADIVHLVKLVRPKMAFVGLESLSLMEESFSKAELKSEIVTFGHSEVYSDFRDFVSTGFDENFKVYKCKNVKETAIIFFSSGTTGLPKGICLSHYGMISQGNCYRIMGYQNDVFLSYATLYWISTSVALLSCIFDGSCRVIVPKFTTSVFWKLLELFKVTFTVMAPIQAITIYKAKRPEGINTTYLSDFLIGGGTLSMAHMHEIREIFPGTNVSLCYGQTEVSGCALFFSPHNPKHIMAMYKKPNSSGTANIGTNCKIVDPETYATLGPNKRGEICLKSVFEMNGYYNMDSSSAWGSDGWLRTGDIAYYDDEGFFYIVDRLKEMLKYQSFHVSPAVVEAVLMTHPSVAAAVVVGLPHDIDGDIPLGVVVLKDRNIYATPEEIQSYVNERVSDREKLRGGVKIIDEIPITASGKIKRIDIRKWACENIK